MAERSCHAGAGVVSAVWPGTGTVIGYNTADLAISLFFIGPLADRYISMEPPPAAMDAGALEGDPPIPGPIVLDADDQALQGTHLHVCVCDSTACSQPRPRAHLQCVVHCPCVSGLVLTSVIFTFVSSVAVWMTAMQRLLQKGQHGFAQLHAPAPGPNHM